MKKGFTLVELLLVVTILGILAGLMLPKLFSQSEKARVAEAVGILTAVRQAEAAYFLEHQTYVRCNSSGDELCWTNNLGMDDPNSTAKYYDFQLASVTNAAYSAQAIRKDDVEDPGARYGGSQIRLNQIGQFSCTGNYVRLCPR